VDLGSKKDLRVYKVGLRWSCNTFSFPKTYHSCNKGKGKGTSTLGEHNTTKSCMLCSGRMNHSLKKENILIFFQLDNSVDARIYFKGEVFGSSLG
jgi:hypothetical protein